MGKEEKSLELWEGFYLLGRSIEETDEENEVKPGFRSGWGLITYKGSWKDAAFQILTYYQESDGW